MENIIENYKSQMKMVNTQMLQGLRLIEDIIRIRDEQLAKDSFHYDYNRKRDNLMYIVGVRGNLVKEKERSTYCPLKNRTPEEIAGLRKRQQKQVKENTIKREDLKKKWIKLYAMKTRLQCHKRSDRN